LDIEKPAHGWATVRLTLPDAQLEFVASYTPRDSICELARVASGLIKGMPESVVIWNTEPVEYEFRFVAADGRTRLEVHEFPDFRRQGPSARKPLVAVEEDSRLVARALWRGLRRLQGMIPVEEFAASWGHPFPLDAVERLGDHLRRV
jgi:hypothetical protein